MLLSHGDALCIDDVAYQRFRAIVRRPGLQRAFGALPLGRPRGIGGTLQAPQRPAEPGEHGGFVDVDADAALAWLRDAERDDADPWPHPPPRASHGLAPGAVRHVLSDWELDGSSTPRAEILRWNANGFARIAPMTRPATAAP